MADIPPSSGRASAWSSLNRAGAICAALTLLMYAAALSLYGVAVTQTAANGRGILDFIIDNRSVYMLKQVLWVMPSAFLIVTFLALTVALFPLDRSNDLIAGVIGILSWAGTFAWPATGDGSLALVMLAFNDVPAPLGVLQTVGVLLISLVMLRDVFSKGVARLGVVTGAIGIPSEALRPWVGWAYAVYGILIFVWLGWVA